MSDFKKWDLQQLEELKGQEESIRQEFKAGRLFEEPQSKWLSKLSAEVSAFANTEGGEIICGVMEEKRGNIRVAGEADGVPDSINRDQLQRPIESHVFPYLTGLRIQRVPLQSKPSRSVLVINVPQGTTAYQADDGRYYGRSELEAKHLPDHEIRLRMARGKVARASVEHRFAGISVGESREHELRKRYATVLEEFAKDFETAVQRHSDLFLDLLSARHEPIIDTIEVEFFVRNDGELTIHDPVIEFSESISEEATTVTRYESPGVTIYPGDERSIPDSRRRLRFKRNVAPGDHVIDWKVYLDNAQPSNGQFDFAVSLRETLQAARARAQDTDA